MGRTTAAPGACPVAVGVACTWSHKLQSVEGVNGICHVLCIVCSPCWVRPLPTICCISSMVSAARRAPAPMRKAAASGTNADCVASRATMLCRLTLDESPSPLDCPADAAVGEREHQPHGQPSRLMTMPPFPLLPVPAHLAIAQQSILKSSLNNTNASHTPALQ